MSTPSYYDLLKSAKIRHGENTAVIKYEEDVYKKFTYNELYVISRNVSDFLSNKISSGEIVGIIIGHNYLLPAIISAIHQNSAIFFFLNPNYDAEYNTSIANDLKISNIFAIRNDAFIGFTSTDISCIAKNDMYFWSKSNCIEPNLKTGLSHNIAYCIRTSGSTGIAKYVAVTHQSIYPNISNLASIFDVKSNDVIYFSTPMTFDPSMIELYLAAECNAALMIAPNDVDVIFPNDSSHGITIWQTTPSKFIMFGNDVIKNKILNDSTSLRILALGGESIYYDFNKLIHEKNKTEIFNLYGITEVSCWASIKKINNIEYDRYNCLGEILSETLVQIFNDDNEDVGNILIGSVSRNCLVGDEITSCSNSSLNYFNWDRYHRPNDIIWRNTGDLGISIDGKIYYKGRNDRIIKRYGHKINMQDVELTALKYQKIIQCLCLWNFKHHSLILFYTSTPDLIKKDFITFLYENLEKNSIPDCVIPVAEMPLNDHGKISRDKIMDLYEKSKCELKNVRCLKTIFIDLLKDLIPVDDYENRSFFDIGGTSIVAVQLANSFENVVGKSYPKLYQSLIDSKYPLFEIIKWLADESVDLISNKRLAIDDDNINKKIRTKNDLKLNILWKFDTGKCVDASITVFTNTSGETYILVGSHSGRVVILNAKTGAPLLDLNMHSRVEAQILCTIDNESTPLAVFGCYDGTLCCISLIEFGIKWKVSLDAKIKSRVCIIKNKIYAATYSSTIYKIDLNTGDTVSFIKIGSKGISADVVNSNDDVFVATLDGICAKIDANDTISWQHTLGSPIFSRPTLIRNDTCVVFCEVSSKIHCFDADAGNKMWTFDEARGLIFSSCSALSRGNSDTLIFGCHDRHTYRITSKDAGRPVLDWKSRNRSEVYATPFSCDSYVISISTDGSLQMIDASSGEIYCEYFLPGEVFSSPAVKDDTIYAGCRDDNVYCVEIIRSA